MLQGTYEREMENGSWTLMLFYSHKHDLVNGAIQGDQDVCRAMYAWVRYSQVRVLD